MKRREFLKIAAVEGFIILTGGRFNVRNEKKVFIRPPGSIKEDDFVYMCIRCGKCGKVCSTGCIKPVQISEGIIEWATPHIIPREKGCLVCLSCGKVCPSGAIQRVKLDEVKIGTAEINRERCLVWKYNKACLVCMEYCPFVAIYTDEKGRPIVNFDICKGCGQCEEHCPVEGEAAIRVSIEGERRISLK